MIEWLNEYIRQTFLFRFHLYEIKNFQFLLIYFIINFILYNRSEKY